MAESETSPSVTMVRMLFEYNYWANEILLSIAEELPDDVIRQTFGGSFDTILATSAHIMQGEVFYSSLWLEGAFGRPADAGSMKELRSMWREHTLAVRRALAGLTEERLESKVAFSRGGYTWPVAIWQPMLNLVNHGTHHRAELADMVTRGGRAPRPIDMADYFREIASP
jgi:uncharacterized damage-inducible protein DinB